MVIPEESTARSPSREFVLLYDGSCGFCSGTVRFILDHDRGGTMRFAPLDGAFGNDVISRHLSLRHVDSIILVKREAGSPESVWVRSEALLQIAEYLGGRWRVIRVLRAFPLGLRDWAYVRFARFRHKLSGRYVSCVVPNTPNTDVRARFLG